MFRKWKIRTEFALHQQSSVTILIYRDLYFENGITGVGLLLIGELMLRY